MPTCDPILLTPVMNHILRIQPRTVLDIGIGIGKWGALVREYTDIWCRRLTRAEWQTKITGVEIFEAYRNPLWELYDTIIIADIRNLLDQLPAYDAILFFEVLEHLPVEDGQRILQWASAHSRNLFFSFTNSPQDTAFGNEAERHISTWTEDMVPPSQLLLATDIKRVYLHENNR